MFIERNHRQAQEIITRNQNALNALEALGVIKVDDLPGFLDAEKAYITSRYEEPPQATLEMEYLEILIKLKESRAVQQQVQAKLLASTKVDEQRVLSAVLRNSIDVLVRWETTATNFELMANITERWTEDSPKWISTLQTLSTRRYRNSLEDLSRLLVQRLIELEKLGIGDTAYKLRKSLAKALKRRSAALSTALNKFNTEAKALGRSTLKFEELLSYTFIADFELLRDTTTDLREKPWSTPAARNALHTWLKMQHAKEEMDRVELEARRLRAWIKKDREDHRNLIDTLQPHDPLLAAELSQRLVVQELSNTRNLRYLDRISREQARGDHWDSVLALCAGRGRHQYEENDEGLEGEILVHPQGAAEQDGLLADAYGGPDLDVEMGTRGGGDDEGTHLGVGFDGGIGFDGVDQDDEPEALDDELGEGMTQIATFLDIEDV